jgi:hypothetical protein
MGRRTACTVADAKARLHDAEAFLAVTTMSAEPEVIVRSGRPGDLGDSLV